jgi:hypothetical protein
MLMNTRILITSGSLFSVLFTIAITSISVYGQENSTNNALYTNLEFIINIREISSYSEKNMIALISTENEVQIKKVDLSKAVLQPGQEDSYSPLKMVDVPITMDNLVKTGSVVYGCVIQLAIDTFSQSIECNIAYASPTASGEPQRIIVVL